MSEKVSRFLKIKMVGKMMYLRVQSLKSCSKYHNNNETIKLGDTDLHGFDDCNDACWPEAADGG